MNSRYIVAIGLFALAAAVFYLGSRYSGGTILGDGSESKNTIDTMSVNGVKALLADGAFEIEIVSSDRNVMIASYDKSSISNMTELVGSELKVNFKTTKSSFLDFGSKKKAKVTLYTSDINRFIIKGAGTLYSNDTLVASSYYFGNEGVGSIDFVAKTEDVVAHNNGVGSIKIKGSTAVLQISNVGVGSVNTKGLKSKNAVATNAGVGSVEVYASDSIALYNNGVGSIKYTGDAVLYGMSNNGIGSIDKK